MKHNITTSTYIGETKLGQPFPVFFDPNYSIFNNQSPVTLITGSPGSGKTFCGLTLATHAAILGKTTFILDRKGDFGALKTMEERGIIKGCEIWALLSEKGKKVKEEDVGRLDPTCFTNDKPTNANLTLDIISVLTGGLTNKQLNALIPIIQDVVEGTFNASLGRVVQKMLSNRDDEIRRVGFTLDLALRGELAKLLVRNKRIKKKELTFNEDCVLANLLGIDLPSDATLKDDYTVNNKISICIMNLILTHIVDLMVKRPVKEQKVLIVDEAWAILATRTGRTAISKVALLGRSRNIATILITQSPSHVRLEEGKNMDNTISSRFAFKNTSATDNLETVEAMNLPDNEGWESVLPDLDNGVCLMQDSDKNIGIVQIIVPSEWKNAFDTNPLTQIEISNNENGKQ